MSNGATSLTLSAPGNGNDGSVTLTPYLTSSITSSCGDANSPSVASLLWFVETDLGKTPTAKATFGINKSPIIYLRENF